MSDFLPPSAELWTKAEADEQFWASKYPELLAECPDQIVAAFEGEIVVFGISLDSVLDQLAAKSVPVQQVSLRFITNDPNRLLR